jgi:hypothetical protein
MAMAPHRLGLKPQAPQSPPLQGDPPPADPQLDAPDQGRL